MTFDMVVNAAYLAVTSAVSALLAVDSHKDEIVYTMGGTMSLPGLDDCICLSGSFRGKIETPFSRG
jgi:hypothetical protein